MLAGPICEGSSCAGLIVVLFVFLAAFGVLVVTVAAAVASATSDRLRRRGWPTWKRRTVTSIVGCVSAPASLYVTLDLPPSPLWVVAVVGASIWWAVHERTATKRWQAAAGVDWGPPHPDAVVR